MHSVLMQSLGNILVHLLETMITMQADSFELNVLIIEVQTILCYVYVVVNFK